MEVIGVKTNVNEPPAYSKRQMTRIEQKLDQLLKEIKHIMATESELLDLLAQANTETNQIGTELQQLLDQAPNIPQDVADGMTALVTRLTAVAAETPTPPPAPAP